MELSEAIKGRRSVRKFKPQAVSRETLAKLLDLAVWAPSGMNRQEWFFVVVQGEKKDQLLNIFSSAFETMRPNLEKVFADKPKIVAGMKQFFQTYGGAPVFIMAYAGKGPSGQWDTHSTARGRPKPPFGRARGRTGGGLDRWDFDQGSGDQRGAGDRREESS